MLSGSTSLREFPRELTETEPLSAIRNISLTTKRSGLLPPSVLSLHAYITWGLPGYVVSDLELA